jgi:two-component system sensor kinase FixL
VQADLIRMTRVSALDEMGSALAHELNQPLTAILLYLQALEREVERLQTDRPEYEARAGMLLEKSTREARRAGSIIQRVRQLVEKRAPERRPADLNLVIDEALELAMLGRRRRVHLERIGPERLPPVFVDPVQIQQVVLNLARNALEACEHQQRPTVTVRTWFEGEAVCFSVADNGPGIPADQMQTLFSAFQSESGHGMGIGLTISKAITQNHLGEMTVEPGGNGHGARFTVKFPAAAQQEAANRDSAAAVPRAAAAEADKT